MIPGSARLSPYRPWARARVTRGTAAAGFATRQVGCLAPRWCCSGRRSPSRPTRLTCTASEPSGTSRTVPRLDYMLSGGLFRGSIVLVSGSAGTGKTTLEAHLIDAACARGERALLIMHEESADELRSSVTSPTPTGSSSGCSSHHERATYRDQHGCGPRSAAQPSRRRPRGITLAAAVARYRPEVERRRDRLDADRRAALSRHRLPRCGGYPRA